MRIYGKRTRKNKFKQTIEKGLFMVFFIVGILATCNWCIDWLGTRDWFVPKTVEILNKGKIGDVVEESTVTLVPIEKLSVVTNDNSEDEIGKTESSLPPSHIETAIRKTFRDDEETAVAVVKAESKLNPYAVNYNCRYGNISKSCNKGDEDNAWSTDCGLTQINVPGKGCPSELFEVDKNLAVASEKYQKRGWNPWVAYTNGSYKKYLNN